jgi:hydroxymethylbilane synthase
MTINLRIGSRPSALALAQTTTVKERLHASVPGLEVEVIPITTGGDKLLTASLAQVGGKGLFIRELEQALSARRIDIAVHSMKDLPAVLAPEYRIAAVPERENPCDALISRTNGGWQALGHNARIGTSSVRRRLEALRFRPDLVIVPLRGNVDTRLRRLTEGDFDAVILAMAGLKRLGRADSLNLTELDDEEFVPSAGQGALAIEVLADGPIGNSAELEQVIAGLNDPISEAEVAAERAFLATIGASCVSPVGVKASIEGQRMSLRALLFSLDGTRSLADRIEQGGTSEAGALGIELGRKMLGRGAGELLGEE